MNIKVTAFTVSQKSYSIMWQLTDAPICELPVSNSKTTI